MHCLSNIRLNAPFHRIGYDHLVVRSSARRPPGRRSVCDRASFWHRDSRRVPRQGASLVVPAQRHRDRQRPMLWRNHEPCQPWRYHCRDPGHQQQRSKVSGLFDVQSDRNGKRKRWHLRHTGKFNACWKAYTMHVSCLRIPLFV